MKPLTKIFRQVVVLLPLLLLGTAAQGANSLLTIGADAAITVAAGADVCANDKSVSGTLDGDGTWCGGPLLVDLVFFEAQGFADYVKLMWETASEIDTAGFHLWRGAAKDGAWTKITTSLIPAEGGPTWGADYAYTDTDVTGPGSITTSWRK
jgi:hypothetical protein